MTDVTMTKKSPSSEDISAILNHYGSDDDFVDPLSVLNQKENGSLRGNATDLFNSHDDDEESTMSKSTSTSYQDEWVRLFECRHFESFLQNEAMRGKLRNCRFRSLCWRVFLKCLSNNVSEWSREIQASRQRYNDIKHRLVGGPQTELKDESIDVSLNNPLCQSQDSPWQRFFDDKEVKSKIQLDVDRCFPDMALFQTSAIKDMMLNILFCYAKEHPHTEYKQGMHELLAPFIFVLHSDHQAYLHAKEMESLLPLANEMLDPSYLEHDSYIMFSHLMDHMAPWFQYGSVDTRIRRPRDVNSKPFSGGEEEEELLPTTPLANKIMTIYSAILQKKDYELFLHLARLDIPQVYGVKWIRLLYGREFMFQDLLVLWDALFADSAELKLVDYVFVAMLMLIRELLLGADHLECLNLLMHFPTTEDIHFLINKALHLRDPTTYSRPANYQFQIFHQSRTGNYMAHTLPRRKPQQVPSSARQLDNSRAKSNLGNKTNAAVTSGFNSLKRITSNTLGSKNGVKEGKPNRMVKSNTYDDLPHPLSTSPSRENITVESRPLPRKANTTPSSPVISTPTRRADTFFGKPRNSNSRKTTPEKEGNDELTALKGRMNDTQNMCKYCATKMEAHILQIQDALECRKLPEEDNLLMAMAGLKQVRDMLNGTLKFAEGSSDSDSININDNYFSEDCGPDLSIKHFDDSRETFLSQDGDQAREGEEENSNHIASNGHLPDGNQSPLEAADPLEAS